MNAVTPHSHFSSVIENLEQIAYLHRACAQIQAGWNVKLNCMATKLTFASHTFEDMEQSAKLDRQIFSLTRVDEYEGVIPKQWKTFFQDLDQQSQQSNVVKTLYLGVKPLLFDFYTELLQQLNPTWDINTRRLLASYLPILEEQLQWAHTTFGDQPNTDNCVPLSNLSSVFRSASHLESVHRKTALWTPIDRVEKAVRPDSMPRATPGALRMLPKNAWTDPQGIGLAAHNQIHGEFTTMELMSRCLYEHPEMPSAFHVDMARHASDESRHARTFMELAALYDVKYGDYPVYTLTYDAYYQFSPACEIGGQQELLWRLILRGTIDEGLALDDLAYQAKSRDYLQQEKFANACRYILADETFHVQGALKWSRYLCQDNEEQVSQARDMARQFLNARLCERRLAYEQQHANLVEQELAYRREVAAAERPDIPFTRVLNRSARLAAGYTEADLDQVVAWGYADAQ